MFARAPWSSLQEPAWERTHLLNVVQKQPILPLIGTVLSPDDGNEVEIDDEASDEEP
jgi:hypothetical protein